MRSFVSGNAVGFSVPLERNGEPYVPDNGTVQWELRGQTGSILSPASSQACPGTELDLTISSGNNIAATGALFEKRTVVVYWTIENQPQVTRISYRLTPFLNHTVDENDVRTFTGLEADALPDDEIDIVQAYLDVAIQVGDATVLAGAVTGGGANETSANRAIIAQAVLNLMSSLQARFIKSDSDGQRKVESNHIDLIDLEQRASDQLSRAVAALTGATLSTPTLAIAGTQTDPITGS